MNFSTTPAFRHAVVSSGSSGTGVELDDDRILYLWVESDGRMRRGWLDRADDLLEDLPPMADVATIMTGVQGSFSVSRVGDRILLFIVHKPGSGSAAGTTGTAYAPGVAAAATCLETFDDGATWSTVGSGSCGNLASSIGLGAGVETGAMIELGGALLIPANHFGNYFGDSTPNPGIYRSTNGGASWSVVFTGDGGPYSGDFSRSIAVDPSGHAWWYAKGGGAGLPYMHLYRSTDNGATWTDLGDAGSPVVNGSLEMTDGGDGWIYLGNGSLYSDGTDFSSLIFEVDKVVYDPLSSEFIPDIGNPLLREISRRRGLAFAGRWVDFLDVGSGWRVGTIGFSA